MDSSLKGIVTLSEMFIFHNFDNIFPLLCVWLVMIERNLRSTVGRVQVKVQVKEAIPILRMYVL